MSWLSAGLTFHNDRPVVKKGPVNEELDRYRPHLHGWLGISISL